MPRKSLIFAALLMGVMLFALPLLMYSSTPFCAVDTANAQDSPCAEQEGTISALEAENSSLKATIEALTSANLRILLNIDAPAGSYSTEDVVETANTIERRLDGFGLSDATVQVIGNQRILIEIRSGNATDTEAILPVITQVSLLELVDFSGLQALAQNFTGQIIATTAQIEQGIVAEDAIQHPTTGQPFESVMTGEAFSAVAAQYDENSNQWFIFFEVARDYQDTLADYTATHIGQPLAIVLDGRVLSVPTIQAALRDGGIISGNFNETEAKTLALQLRSGSLVLPVTVESVETITNP